MKMNINVSYRADLNKAFVNENHEFSMGTGTMPAGPQKIPQCLPHN